MKRSNLTGRTFRNLSVTSMAYTEKGKYTASIMFKRKIFIWGTLKI